MATRSTRQILEDVAAGRLDPDEAARLLAEARDASGSEAADDTDAGSGPGDRASQPSVPEIARVSVQATSRRVRLIGDPEVATFVVQGSHQVRRDGSTLHITGDTEPLPPDETFTLLSGGRFREAIDRIQHGLGQQLELTIRIRPDLAVGAEVMAGSLRAEGLGGLDHVRVTTGSLRATGIEVPTDVLVQAGSGHVQMRQTRGRSRVRCESGSLTLTLGEGTDARIRHDVQLGRFTTQPSHRADRDIVVGTGAAEIDVEGVMAAVTVVTP